MRTAYRNLSGGAALALALAVAGPALAAGPDLGSVAKQSTNWTAIAMFAVFVAIGFSRVNQARAEIVEECHERGYPFVRYVNSRAANFGDVAVGDNTFVFEDNVIQPFVTIGDDVILWSGNHIGHDVTIADHVFIASHVVVSGNCTIGAYSFIGVNATLRDGITIGPRCVIGAGAVVMRDTDEGDVLAVPHTRLFPKRSWELDGF